MCILLSGGTRGPVPSGRNLFAARAGRCRSPAGRCANRRRPLPRRPAGCPLSTGSCARRDSSVCRDRGSSGRVRYQTAARCPLAADLFQKFGNAGVGEHVGVYPAARRIDARIGKHVVQQSPHRRFGIVHREPDAASQRVGRQHLAGNAADFAIRHAHNYLFHLPSIFPGLR